MPFTLIFFSGSFSSSTNIIEELSSSDLIAREGTNVTLNCASKGYPEPKLSWYREHYKPGDAGNWQKDSLVQKLLAYFNQEAYEFLKKNLFFLASQSPLRQLN
ncbi:hypothetical protein TNIN_232821 [Trichonephila inaurata madagascariensis]|uniref:Ig-like domain-containing protein n=1 Tax=Trichonephila inaurata madagascariensis TaxID=2747483 RepID=A0A8X6JYN8_9ARAC|nr:hypothetical protein TNIN_232821 [Trichonephila inaurata madagascariensis]